MLKEMNQKTDCMQQRGGLQALPGGPRTNLAMPISDAPRIESNVTLKNGLVVTIRDLRTDDRDAIARAVAGLEAETIYTRLFGYRRITATEIDRIMRVDAAHELAFVAAIGTPPTHQIIGSCRSVELETKSSRRAAEAAFVVEEDYQGLGIAGRLFDHLVHVARSRGIADLRGDVLASNQSMLRVVRRSGLPTRFRHDRAAVRLIISLT